MAESNTGKALYAVHQGTYVVKLIGEIRVPICTTLDSFIETMFCDNQLNSVLIDLSETHLIDSTALGLVLALDRRSTQAKIGGNSKKSTTSAKINVMAVKYPIWLFRKKWD